MKNDENKREAAYFLLVCTVLLGATWVAMMRIFDEDVSAHEQKQARERVLDYLTRLADFAWELYEALRG